MSLALIEESAKEVRRLAVAGSPLAVGDFRLKKLAAPLEQAGAKVPVFAQVAKAINDLVNGKEAESAARLLNLSTLLNAILYTQGLSGAEGNFRELETFTTKCASTRTTARVLKPLVEALTASGAGRFEVVKSAVERGAFNDLRLIDLAIQALGDSYGELADLVAEKILPAYGPGIVPRLKSTFDLKGKKHDARKLSVMHALDPAGTVELCKTALDDGSPEVKAAAIGCLGKHEECLPLVMEQAKAKNKQLRAAALEALAGHDRPEVTALFAEIIKGNALDVLVGPFRWLRNRQVLKSLLEEGGRVFELVIKGDSDQIARFTEILDCLTPRKDAEVEAFLLERFVRSDALAKVKAAQNSTFAGADLMWRLSILLYGIGTPKALEAILAKREVLPNAAFAQVWRSALRHWPVAKVFDEFSPLLVQTKGAGKEKAEEIERFMLAVHDDFAPRFHPLAYGAAGVDEQESLNQVTWDGRWLDAAIKANRTTMVSCLARPGHRGAIDYLVKLNLGDTKRAYDSGLAIRALVRCEYPKVTEHFLGLIEKKIKGGRNIDNETQWLLSNAQYLPKADLPQLDAFAAKLDERFVDSFLEAIAPLRPVIQQN